MKDMIRRGDGNRRRDRRRLLLGAVAIVAATCPLSGSPDFPEVWSLFVPVDTSVGISSLKSIPNSLPREGGKGSVAVREARFSATCLDLAAIAGGFKEQRRALVCANVKRTTDTSLWVGTAADWWVTWYVNGKEAFKNGEGNVTTRYSVTNYLFELPLKAGDNLIVVDARSGSQGFKLWAASGKELADARAELLRRFDERSRPVIEESNRRIKQLRMGTLTVKAKANATVSIRQLSHEFRFGTAIGGPYCTERDPDDQDSRRYRDTLKAYFNDAVHEGALKWPACERDSSGRPDYSTADQVYDWCSRNGLTMRGHNIYSGADEKAMPKWVIPLDNAALLRHMERRGKDVTAHFKGRIFEYDLCNEMIPRNWFAERLGPGIVADMARWAREGDPKAQLYLNDDGVTDGPDIGRYVDQIRGFLKEGIPYGGIGTQSHFIGDIDLENAARDLDSLGQFGLPIKITEFDLVTRDEAYKAKALDGYYRLCFGHPAVAGILMWGFWEGRHWRPEAALWKRDWTVTPAGKVYTNLVTREWHTEVTGKADKNGMFKTPAFYGDYDISSAGKSIKAHFTRQDQTKVLEIQ